MSRRIDIELTSLRPDGTWTWRAAGAREPKGVVEPDVLPANPTIAQVLKAEVETDLDGTRVLAIVPPKVKPERSDLIALLPSEKPFEPVTQKLARGERGPRAGDRKGPRRRAGKPGESRGERSESVRPRRAFTEPPPELPTRPKPKRVKPRRENLDAVLAQLPESHRAIAEKVVSGGIPAVRAAIQEQNAVAVAEGREKITADALVAEAERLLPHLRKAEWIDKALYAQGIIEEVDLRDLRSIINVGESLSGHDDRTRELLAAMKSGLVARQEAEMKLWIDDIRELARIGRIVRALRLSSQPPKAGVPLPAEVASLLVDAATAALAADAPSERWITILENAAFSPVHARVLPAATPAVVSEDLVRTVTRLGPLMPQVASLFGIVIPPDAKMPRMLPPSRPDRAKKGRAALAGSPRDSAPTGRSTHDRVSSPKKQEKSITADGVASTPSAPQGSGETSEDESSDASAPQPEVLPDAPQP